MFASNWFITGALGTKKLCEVKTYGFAPGGILWPVLGRQVRCVPQGVASEGDDSPAQDTPNKHLTGRTGK